MIPKANMVWLIALLKSYTVIAVIVFDAKIGVKTDRIAGMIRVRNCKKIKNGFTFDNL